MTYEILVTNIGDWLWKVNVIVYNGSIEVISGEINVSCETEAEARKYGEYVFLPDLRTNYPRLIGSLVFPWEVVVSDPTTTPISG